jgi:hypothetical protein
MYFGKYLLDQKIITASQLIEGMATQFESQPSLLRLLSSSGYLSDEKIVNLIGETLLNHKSLVDTLVEQNVLDDEKVGALLGERSVKGVGLGQSLITLGYLNIAELDNALKAYISVNSTQEEELAPEPEPEPEPEPGPEPEPAKVSNISAAALESMKELGLSSDLVKESIDKEEEKQEPHNIQTEENVEISNAALESLKALGISADAVTTENEVVTDIVEVPETFNKDFSLDDEIEDAMVFHGLKGEYLSLYNQKLFDDFQERIKKLVGGFDVEVLEGLHKDLSLLLGASSLAGLEYSEKILDCYCKIFEKVIDKKVDFYEFNFMAFGAMFKGAINLTWELREEIIKNSSEQGLINDKEWKEKFVKNLKKGLLVIKEKDAA